MKLMKTIYEYYNNIIVSHCFHSNQFVVEFVYLFCWLNNRASNVSNLFLELKANKIPKHSFNKVTITYVHSQAKGGWIKRE